MKNNFNGATTLSKLTVLTVAQIEEANAYANFLLSIR